MANAAVVEAGVAAACILDAEGVPPAVLPQPTDATEGVPARHPLRLRAHPPRRGYDLERAEAQQRLGVAVAEGAETAVTFSSPDDPYFTNTTAAFAEAFRSRALDPGVVDAVVGWQHVLDVQPGTPQAVHHENGVVLAVLDQQKPDLAGRGHD